jgi:putative addiction module component (TIGR02574 family)
MLMNTTYEAVEQAARQLTIPEKAALAQTLLMDLDEGEDEDVEALWVEEARRRYEAYLRGEMEAIDGDEVMARLRSMLK